MAKHMSKYPHPSKRLAEVKRKASEVELCIKRDEILESDPMFCENVRSLYRRCASGKLAKEAVRSLRPALINAALRRAGLSRSVRQQLILS